MSSTGVKVTGIQERIMRCIIKSIKERGFPPTLREIGADVGLTSGSSVSYQLHTLELKGLIKRGHTPRAITVLAPNPEPYEPVELTEEEVAQLRGLGQGQVVGVVTKLLNARLKRLHDAQ